MKRVVITAVSVIGPIARGYEAFVEALRGGRSGGGQVTLFDASAFPTHVAAEVKDFDEAAPLAALAGRGHKVSYLGAPSEDRKTALGLAAILDLVDGAEIDDLGGRRCALHLGTGLSSASVRELEVDLLPFIDARGGFDGAAYGRAMASAPSPSPWRHLTTEVNRLAASALGIRGPSSTNFAACAASTQAIGRAFRDVQAGRVDRAIAGGMDSMIHPFGMISFMRLGALTTRNDTPERASRPFDRDRDGFLIGEGAAMVLLESLDSARARGARILGEVLGYGTSMDAHAATAPHPEGRGARMAMSRAISDAGIAYEEIDYINTHGTGTPLNDSTESKAIAALWATAGAGEPPPVSSTKSMTGHLIAAAGAIEAVACVAALERSFLPPTINIEDQDPECALDVVSADCGRPSEVRFAMNNSFGFGGQNAALVLARWEGS